MLVFSNTVSTAGNTIRCCITERMVILTTHRSKTISWWGTKQFSLATLYLAYRLIGNGWSKSTENYKM